MNQTQKQARARRLIIRALEQSDREYRARMNARLRNPGPTRPFREYMAERASRGAK